MFETRKSLKSRIKFLEGYCEILGRENKSLLKRKGQVELESKKIIENLQAENRQLLIDRLHIKKNKFPVLDVSKKSMDTEISKFVEECTEFIDAYNDDNCIEEFFDVMQVMVNILSKKGLLNKLNTGLENHNKKIRSRGWKIEKYL